MINVKYNLARHIELLNSQQVKSAYWRSELKLELLEYSIAVGQHIFWQDRFDVALIMQSFLNKEIDAQEFHDIVFGLRRTHLIKVKEFLSKLASGEIKEFYPNKDADKLKGFLTSLYCLCEHFEIDFDEEYFYNCVLDGFLKFKKILKEEH